MSAFRQMLFGNGEPFPETLHSENRAEGRRIFYRFYLLNGISVACLMNNMLILYAVRNGMADPLVAVMASFVHLTMPFLIAGKHAIARFGAARTRALGWFFRYVCALLMVAAPFAGRFLPPFAVSGLILLGAFGFAAFRSIGVAAVNPLQGEVAEPGACGHMVSSILLCVQSTYLLSLGLILFCFHYTDALWLYQTILAVGCLVGLYASTLVARVPETTAPRLSAGRPLRGVLRTVFASRSSRALAAAWCTGLAAKSLVLPFMMIALKSGYLVSDFYAVVFTLLMALGTVSSGLINRHVSDRIGSRSVLGGNLLLLMGAAGFWAMAPEVFSFFAVGAVFFFSGFAEVGIDIGLNQHFLEVIPKEHRVGSSLVMRITSGAAAGLAAFVVGAGLLGALPEFHLAGMDIFRSYFLVILCFLPVPLWFVFRMPPDRHDPADTAC